jgi:hypothetical protein
MLIEQLCLIPESDDPTRKDFTQKFRPTRAEKYETLKQTGL